MYTFEDKLIGWVLQDRLGMLSRENGLETGAASPSNIAHCEALKARTIQSRDEALNPLKTAFLSRFEGFYKGICRGKRILTPEKGLESVGLDLQIVRSG
jgi:hypothetical protein